MKINLGLHVTKTFKFKTFQYDIHIMINQFKFRYIIYQR